ncbi:MAG: sugar ABC transporter permease [Actinomycetota bacterium]
MEILETLVTWVLLIALALAIGAAVWRALTRIGEAASGSSTVPAIAGVAAGLAAGWFILIDQRLAFLVTVLVGIVIGVVVGRLVGLLVRVQAQLSLVIAVVVALAVALLTVVALDASTLFHFAVVIVAAISTLLVLGASQLPTSIRTNLARVAGVAAVIGAVDWFQAFDRMERMLASPEMARIAVTLWAVVLAVGASAALFIAANLAVNRARTSWAQFTAGAGAVIGFALFGVLDGNRLLQIVGPRESVATGLHDAVNNGPWTLAITSVVIGGIIGYLGGRGYGATIDDRVRSPRIGLGIGLILGLVWGVLFATRIPVDTTVRVLWTAVVGAVLVGIVGYLIGRVEQDRMRAAVGAGGGLVVGLAIGGLLKNIYQPRLETVPLIAAPVVGALVFTAVARLLGRRLGPGALLGAMFGWLIGTFGYPSLGGGPELETMLATGLAGLLGGAAFGLLPHPNAVARTAFEQKARAPIFLAPALASIGLGLVIPLIRTFYLSLFDSRSVEYVGSENYRAIFTDPQSFDYEDRLWLFESRLFWLALLLGVVALVLGFMNGRRTGNSFGSGRVVRRTVAVTLAITALLEFALGRQTDGISGGNPLVIAALVIAAVVVWFVPIGTHIGNAVPQARIDFSGAAGFLGSGAMLLFAMSVFSVIRGTVFNNLWWVFVVTIAVTAFGLVVAVLADRVKNEAVAKSFVFMPLAISFVGAGIIWRFMYIARDPSKEQTGVMNALWVGLGRISTEGYSRTIGIVVMAVLAALIVALAIFGWNEFRRGRSGGGIVVGALIVLAPVLWVLGRFAITDPTQLSLWRFGTITIGGGMGGTGTVTDTGVIQDTTIFFVQDSLPFNNLFLMLVLIWIQTGFAMVIFSAAIKAVPAEYIEAAKMDGANDSQIFWRITLPTIAPTIGVVVTTLIVLVMKVFDIVRVMTNGNFETQVIANEMWQRAFTELNFGLGSALAFVLFLAVVPVMAYNIRNMQREL